MLYIQRLSAALGIQVHAAVVHRQLSVICDRLIKIRPASYRIAR